jgi:hypothetical protein
MIDRSAYVSKPCSRCESLVTLGPSLQAMGAPVVCVECRLKEEGIQIAKCRFCGCNRRVETLDINGNCKYCVDGMARTNGD